MKYIITDKGEVRTGNSYHVQLAAGCKGKVVSAGHYRIGTYSLQVYGESIGYNIKSKPEDALLVEKHINQ